MPGPTLSGEDNEALANEEPGDPAADLTGGPGVGGGQGGDAAGGPGRRSVPARATQPGRGLTAYLWHPRPDAWGKALIAPACFLLAASSTGRFGAWNRFAVLWLVLELLIYPARYQWNDIRGIDADQAHAERGARSRLPVGTTAQARRRSIGLSRLTAAARILAALLIGVLAGLGRPVLVLAGSVFVIATLYEWLRAPRSQSWRRSRVIAVWLVVGLGYVVRGGLGLSTAGLAWTSPAMAAGLVCAGSFGIMFVLLTWALEAASYCAADADGGWHARAEVAAKPHLAALLPHLGRPVAADGVPAGQGQYCGTDKVLRERGRRSAPWNLALLAAVVSGAAEGVLLARPDGGGTGALLAAVAVSSAGAALLAGCRSSPGRWVITVACSPALVAAAALLARPALPILVAAPWLAIAGVYSAFRDWSYHDLAAAGPRLAAALRKARL